MKEKLERAHHCIEWVLTKIGKDLYDPKFTMLYEAKKNLEFIGKYGIITDATNSKLNLN